MDLFLQQAMKFVSDSFNRNIQFVIELFTNFTHFISEIRTGKVTFSAGLSFSLMTAICMSFFELIVFLLNKNELNVFIFCYMVLFTWFMIVICGVVLWLTSILFGGAASLLKTITAIQFLSLGLVFIRILELPSLIISHKVILSQSEPFQKDISALISQSIFQNPFSFTSSVLVFAGYIIFGYWIYRMLRALHQINWWRGLGAICIGAWLIGKTVTYVQYPIVQILLFANQT